MARKGIIQGSIIGVLKGDTRSLDSGYIGNYTEEYYRSSKGETRSLDNGSFLIGFVRTMAPVSRSLLQILWRAP